MSFHMQDGDQYSISKDMSGVCRLTIKSADFEDNGEYTCKINKQTDKTETVLTVVGTSCLIEEQLNCAIILQCAILFKSQ